MWPLHFRLQSSASIKPTEGEVKLEHKVTLSISRVCPDLTPCKYLPKEGCSQGTTRPNMRSHLQTNEGDHRTRWHVFLLPFTINTFLIHLDIDPCKYCPKGGCSQGTTRPVGFYAIKLVVCKFVICFNFNKMLLLLFNKVLLNFI